MKYYIYLLLPFSLVLSNCTKTCDSDLNTLGTELKQVLVSKSWVFDEIKTYITDKEYYYKRGASGNTVNYNNYVIKFNADNSGSIFDGTDSTQMQLNFDTNNPYKLTFKVLQPGGDLNITWSDLIIKEDQLSYTEYYKKNGTLLFSTVKLTPQ